MVLVWMALMLDARAADLWPRVPAVEGVQITKYVGIQVPTTEPEASPGRGADLLSALIEANPFEVPPTSVQQTYDGILEEIRQGRGGAPLELTEAQQVDLRKRATFAVKAGVVLREVSTKENLVATDADMDARYRELAHSRGWSIDKTREVFSTHENDLRRQVTEQKVIAWLLERAVFRPL